MQIVYISNRPKILHETLQHVAALMPFIDHAVVCIPDKLMGLFEGLGEPPIALTFVKESELQQAPHSMDLSSLDHQTRNYTLRARLIQHACVEPRFIMSDDDSRPLKQVEISDFISNGLYRRYYFYDLARWDSNQTDFDKGQLATFAVLNSERLPHLSYASHMPQIIDKALFVESAHYFSEHAKHHPLCEWSSYFNYAGSKYPDKFHSPEAYRTLCWPEHPLAWSQNVHQAEFLFENFTPSAYHSGLPFGELGSSLTDPASLKNIGVDKIIGWQKYGISLRHPEQRNSLLKYLTIRTMVNKLFGHLFH